MGRYLTGCGLVILVAGACTWAGVEVRCRLLPAWRGAWARLAEAVATTGAVTLLLEALGVVGRLDRWGLGVGGAVVAAVAGGMRRGGAPLPARPRAQPPPGAA